MSITPPTGRASIFRGKANGVRVQGLLTKVGGQRFEHARRDLARLYKQARGTKPATVSDADVIEYLARGAADTLAYLRSDP